MLRWKAQAIVMVGCIRTKICNNFQRITSFSSCCLVCSMALIVRLVSRLVPNGAAAAYSTKIRASRTRNATLGPSTMRRVLFGLLFFSLTARGGAFGGEAQAPSSDLRGSLEKPSPAGQSHPSKSSKRVSRAEPDAHSGPRSLPLSSAAAYAFEHPTSLPMSSPSQPVPPASKAWTGFYVGAGAGAAHP